MTYKVYKFDRPTIDTERRVSFTRGALVRTNDTSWIAKFGRTVSEVSNSGEDSILTVEALEKEEVTSPKIPKKTLRKARKPSAPKKRALDLGDTTAILGDDVDTKSYESSESSE